MEATWKQLHERYYPVAQAIVGRLGIAPSDVEDVCQEVFLQVFRYIDRFERRADFKTWLYKLCISQASRVHRRDGVQQRLRHLLSEQTPLERVAAPHAWDEEEAQRRVNQALAAMKEIHRRVFVVFEIEGKSGDEIARLLKLPTASIRRRLHHARTEFSALIEEAGL